MQNVSAGAKSPIELASQQTTGTQHADFLEFEAEGRENYL